MPWAAMPLLPPAVALAGGIALAPWAPLGVSWAAWLLAVVAGAILIVTRHVRAAAAAILVAVVAIGALRSADLPAAVDDVARLALPRTARVEGRLAAAPRRWAPERARLLIEVARVDGAAHSGRIQATVYGVLSPLAEGQRVALDARLHRAAGFRNPGTFDYAAALARDGIRVVGSGRAEQVEALEPPAPPWAARVRRAAVQAMQEALPPASAALLAGLLLGERVDLPGEIHDAFRRAGVYHVLAVSGFNVALLASAVWGLTLLATRSRRVASAVALAAVMGFAMVVGAEPSVLRAALMAGLVLAALLLEREAAVANSLGLAALVILAARPGDLLDPGFQLSFAATAGIVAAPLPRRWPTGALGVSAAAQLAVLPVTLVHFNQLSTIGVAANLFAVPLAATATVVGLAAAALAFALPAVAALLFEAVWPVLLALRAVAALAAAVPGAVVHLPAPGPAAVAAYGAALLCARLAWRRRAEDPPRARRLGAAALALVAAAVVLGAWPLLRPADGRLRVTVLDVGQADAIVIEAPDGRAVVVDAGAGGPHRLDAGERVVAPFLWNRGVRRLAATIVTHPDLDHAGGMPALHRLFPVDRRLHAADLPSTLDLAGAVITTIRTRGRPSNGAGEPSPRHARPNEEAVVLRIELGHAGVLLASDIEAATERALLAAGVPVRATALKVAHHGSRTSTTAPFVTAVRPSVAVISVGARNAYGHPDAAVVERLTRAGARVHRTDRDGAVLLETDGRTLLVRRWADRAVERHCLDPETIC